jgi:hypothetical protein
VILKLAGASRYREELHDTPVLAAYHCLSPDIRQHADRCFALFQRDPQHPSLQFQKKGQVWAARVGPGHRALAKERQEGLVWFWIGAHDEYERLLRSL